jgi:hypothetical protein
MIASKVRIVGPCEVVEAGPSKVSECPGPHSKGKGRVVEFLEMGAVEGNETFGMSDEQWGARQQFLVDRIFNKRLEIEVLFKEIAAIEAMMQE